MKTILGPVIGALVLVATPVSAATQAEPSAQADQPAKLAEAHAIIDIMFPPAERQQTFDKLIDQFASQYRASIPAEALADPGVRAILDKYLDKAREMQRPLIARHMPQIFDATAIAYTHEFSLAELKDIHAFALTPSGRHYLSRSAALIGDPAVAKANAALLADAQQIMKSMFPELMADLVAYMKAHPDVAAKLKASDRK